MISDIMQAIHTTYRAARKISNAGNLLRISNLANYQSIIGEFPPHGINFAPGKDFVRVLKFLFLKMQ